MGDFNTEQSTFWYMILTAMGPTKTTENRIVYLLNTSAWSRIFKKNNLIKLGKWTRQ